jgi:hypothetical protein
MLEQHEPGDQGPLVLYALDGPPVTEMLRVMGHRGIVTHLAPLPGFGNMGLPATGLMDTWPMAASCVAVI